MSGLTDWVKDNGLNMIIMLVTAVFTLGLTYAALTGDIRELNERVHNLNERVRDQNNYNDKLLEKLDSRYVNEEQFEEFRKGLDKDIKGLRSDVRYLIELQIENERK